MRLVHRYDSKGVYIEDVVINDKDSIPKGCTDVKLPQPNWKPKFVDGKWIETITQEELNEKQNITPTLTDRERLDEIEQLVADMIEMQLMGG